MVNLAKRLLTRLWRPTHRARACEGDLLNHAGYVQVVSWDGENLLQISKLNDIWEVILMSNI